MDENKPKINYLMFDGSLQHELKPEDQINCRGILVKEWLTSAELADLEIEWQNPVFNITSESVKYFEEENKLILLYEKLLRKKNIITLTSVSLEPNFLKIGDRVVNENAWYKLIDIETGVMIFRKLFWHSLFRSIFK